MFSIVEEYKFCLMIEIRWIVSALFRFARFISIFHSKLFLIDTFYVRLRTAAVQF